MPRRDRGAAAPARTAPKPEATEEAAPVPEETPEASARAARRPRRRAAEGAKSEAGSDMDGAENPGTDDDPWKDAPPLQQPDSDPMTDGDEPKKAIRKRRTPPAEPPARKPSTTSVIPDFNSIDADDLELGSLADADEYLSVLFYGREGTTKTTSALLASALPDPGRVLLVNAEGGAKARALTKHGVDASRIAVWPPQGQRVTFEGLERLFYRVASDLQKDPHSWAAVVWDSGTEILQTILDHIVEDVIAEQQEIIRKTNGRAGNVKVRDRFDTDRDDYRKMSNMVRSLVRKFRYLPCHFIMTALVRTDTDEKTKKTAYTPALTPALQTDILGYMDVVVYCKSINNRGSVVFYGKSVNDEEDRGKDRFNALPAELVNPTFDRIVGYVRGDILAENDPLQDAMPGGAMTREEHAEKQAAPATKAPRTRPSRAKKPVPEPEPDEAQAAPPESEPEQEKPTAQEDAAAKSRVKEDVADAPPRRGRRSGTRTKRETVTYADEPPF